MREHIPEFKYYKIDENEFSKKSLESLESINASMFLFEKSNYSEIGKYTKILIDALEKEAGSELKRDFVIWLRQKFKSLKVADIDLKFDSVNTLEEDVAVFETRIQKEIRQLKKQCRLEGITEGQLKGKSEGKLEGKLEVAKTMLQKGFDVKTISQITGLDAQEILK